MIRPGNEQDSKKIRFELVPTSAFFALGAAYTYGAKKHSDHGWRTVPNASEEYFASGMRHVLKHRAGETIDKESGLPSLAMAMADFSIALELDGFDLIEMP